MDPEVPTNSFLTISKEVHDATFERELDQILQESLESSERLLEQVEESEQLGIRTAEELAEQREKLERADRGLDKIETTTVLIHRDLNLLDGVVGHVRNKLDRIIPRNRPCSSSGVQPLREPAVVRVLLTRCASFRSWSSVDEGFLSEATLKALKDTRWDVLNSQIEENLDLFNRKMETLKELATDIGTDLVEQNELIDKMEEKTARNADALKELDNRLQERIAEDEADDKKKNSTRVLISSRVWSSKASRRLAFVLSCFGLRQPRREE